MEATEIIVRKKNSLVFCHTFQKQGHPAVAFGLAAIGFAFCFALAFIALRVD